jgi:hypothetical protein
VTIGPEFAKPACNPAGSIYVRWTAVPGHDESEVRDTKT